MIDELWLVHPEDEMCAAFRRRFEGLPRVRVVQARFEELEPHDCFVTAGNAFGIMTAGIDAAVIRRLGEELMLRVQHRILDEYFGEQPVGTAFVVPTGDASIPYVIHAPTMRVPGNIEGTDKVYAATWAALLAVVLHNRDAGKEGRDAGKEGRDAGKEGGGQRGTSQRIDVVAIPAMGTGFGGVPFDEAARQMAAAYRHLLEPPHRLDWDFVIERQKAICYDAGRQVVR